LKLKLKGRIQTRFAVEVIQAELQALPNTHTDHDFQDAFKKLWKCWEGYMHVEGDYIEGDVGQYSRKFVFNQIAM
jgi:hypothetical protein